MKKIEAKAIKPMTMVRIKATKQYMRVISVSWDGTFLEGTTKDARAIRIKHNEVEFDNRPPETRGTWE